MSEKRQRPKSWKAASATFKEARWRKSFLVIEWCCEWISYWLSHWALLEVLEYLGKLSLLVALIVWIYGCNDRKQAAESAKQEAADARKSRHYVAWQTINSAVGKPGNAGRADALQDLNRDKIQLDGISLTGGMVLVGPLLLTNASMTRADFSGGTFEQVNFSRAILDFSKWENVRCKNCSFQEASLWAATIKGSTFVWCDFGFVEGAKNTNGALFLTQFTGDRTEFTVCNFAGAEFPMNDWSSAYFPWCNLAFADISNVHGTTNDTLFCCNLFGATASPDTIVWAQNQLVTFTNVVTLEKWKGCATNGLIPYERGGPEFMKWASNQFAIYHKTNDPQAWLDWRRVNLQK